MDLGSKPQKPEVVSSPAGKSEEQKVNYPSFTLNDEVAKEFHKECPDLKLGDEITATVKMKVTRVSADNYGHSVGFDVTQLDDITSSGDEKPEDEEKDEDGDKEADEAEEKVLGFKRKSKKPLNEIPDTSAKSLED